MCGAVTFNLWRVRGGGGSYGGAEGGARVLSRRAHSRERTAINMHAHKSGGWRREGGRGQCDGGGDGGGGEGSGGQGSGEGCGGDAATRVTEV